MRKGASPGVQALFADALRQHRAGHLGEAERLYNEVLRVDSRHADALHFLGVLAHQAGRHEAAIALIDKAIAQNGRAPAFHNNRGIVLLERGRMEEAAVSFGRAAAYKPDYVDAHYNLGVALQALGKLKEAAVSFERAVTYKPDHVDAHYNLGVALQALGRLEAASAAYQRALIHKPDFAEAHNNRGILFLEQGSAHEAAACFEQALRHAPERAQTWSNWGSALKELGDVAQAVAAYQRAVSLEADNADARLGLAVATIPLFAASVEASRGVIVKFERSVDVLGAWSHGNLVALGSSVGSNLPFYLAYRPGHVHGVLARYGELICTAAAARWPRDVERSPTRSASRSRIRLAIVSAHVRQHPVWDVVLRGFVAHLDRSRFDIHLYHTKPATDAEAEWAKSQVARFVQGPLPLQAWLDEIEQDRPDILFYPEVGMDSATYALAALRLAPLQIAGWGHPVTTGMPSIDLYLSGELLEASGAAQHYRERLIRLPGTGVCTELPDSEAHRWAAPPRRSGVVRFALCQQPIKFDPADDALIARIAATLGPSEFWLAAPQKLRWTADRLHARLATAFQAEGLDPQDHLRVMPWLSRGEFLGFLDEMDIYLDCPAFSGYTTARQALHRGLPIVTLEGEYLRQRLAAGLLRQIGRATDIAHSRLQYEDIAVRLAQECREQPAASQGRREAIQRAAPDADGNRAAVAAFERIVIEALRPLG